MMDNLDCKQQGMAERIEWIMPRLLLLLAVFPIYLSYSFLHEQAHLAACNFIGAPAELHMDLFMPRVEMSLNGVTLGEYLLVSFAPYFVGLLGLAILAILKHSETRIAYLSILPIIDFTANAIGLIVSLPLGMPNDFADVLRTGFRLGTEPFMVSLLAVALVFLGFAHFIRCFSNEVREFISIKEWLLR